MFDLLEDGLESGDHGDPRDPDDETEHREQSSETSELSQSFTQRDNTIGDPGDSQYGDVQSRNGPCAVVAAGGVIHAMTGQDIPEPVLVEKAIEHGLYDDRGTIPENFGKLLGIYEIPYHVNENGTMQDIVKELAYGRKVLVAIDGPELWGQQKGWVGEMFDRIQESSGSGGNHAIWITSVNNVNDLNPENITVTLNDSGDPNGTGRVYPLNEFIDAAEDSNFHYVATNEAAPGTPQYSGPDPDLAAFPGIKDIYEIRYGESLVANGAEMGSGPADVLASQSDEFDIEQMPLGGNKFFFVKQTYPFEAWLVDRAAESGISLSIEDAQKLIGPDYHLVPREYNVWLSETFDGPVGAEAAHQGWIWENFHEVDSVGEVRARLAELGHETQTHTAATYQEAMDHVQSTGTPKLMAVDTNELELGDKPLHHFWEKFKEVMNVARPSLAIISFIPAVGYGIVETVSAAFDLGNDAPDGLVRAEFGDDFVNVTWPNGEEESYSHNAFQRSFEDSRFSYISY